MSLRLFARRLPALLVSALVAPALSAQVPSVQPPFPGNQSTLDGLQLGTDRVMTSAVALTFATHAPGDTSRLFVLEKRGRILILDLNTLTVNGTPFLDIDAKTASGSEWGLLGMAFHPDYANNGLFYVNYTRESDKDSVTAEYSVSGDPNVADAGSERVVITLDDLQSNHNAGWIGFGPNDGYLYITTGDGGNGCDTGTFHTAGSGNAQDIIDNLWGKILRIDPLGGPPYGIPATNPFVGITGDDEIWCFGLRNPWRSSFDSATGDLYIGDVGQDIREEVDYQLASSPGGENYGWRCREGNLCASAGASGCPTSTGCTCPATQPGVIQPIHDYSHQSPPFPATFVCSVIGGYVYRGAAIPSLQGHYFFADNCGDAFWGFRVSPSGKKVGFKNWTPLFQPSLDGFVLDSTNSFGEDANGEVYIVASLAVFKIVPRP